MILHLHMPAPARGLCAPSTLPFRGVQVMGGIAMLLVNIGKQTIAWTGYDNECPVRITEAS